MDIKFGYPRPLRRRKLAYAALDQIGWTHLVLNFRLKVGNVGSLTKGGKNFNQNTWTGRMPLSTRELYSIYGELQRLILCCLQLILQGLTPVKCEDGNLWRCVKNLRKVSEASHNLTRWVFPKIVGFPPKSSISNRGFHYYKPSILVCFPLFLETPKYDPPWVYRSQKAPPVPIEFVFHGLSPLERQVQCDWWGLFQTRIRASCYDLTKTETNWVSVARRPPDFMTILWSKSISAPNEVWQLKSEHFHRHLCMSLTLSHGKVAKGREGRFCKLPKTKCGAYEAIPISAWAIYLQTKMWNQSSCGKKEWLLFASVSMSHPLISVDQIDDKHSFSAWSFLLIGDFRMLAASQAGTVTGMTRKNYHGFGCNLDTPAIKFPIWWNGEAIPNLAKTVPKKTPQPLVPNKKNAPSLMPWEPARFSNLTFPTSLWVGQTAQTAHSFIESINPSRSSWRVAWRPGWVEKLGGKPPVFLVMVVAPLKTITNTIIMESPLISHDNLTHPQQVPKWCSWSLHHWDWCLSPVSSWKVVPRTKCFIRNLGPVIFVNPLRLPVPPRTHFGHRTQPHLRSCKQESQAQSNPILANKMRPRSNAGP